MAYLRHWCSDDGKMWITPTDGRKSFRASPLNFAAENGLYDTSKIPELAMVDQERDLSDIEGIYEERWPEVFDHIGDPATKLNLSRYLALTYLRHPDQIVQAKSTLASWRKVADMIKGSKEFEVVKADGSIDVVPTSELVAFSEETTVNIKSTFLKEMRTSLEAIAHTLCARKWGVVFEKDKKPVFVTGDRPIILEQGLCKLPFYGFGTPGTIVTFPISPTRILKIDDGLKEDGLHYPILRLPDLLNTTVISAAQRFIFSATELPSLSLPASPSPAQSTTPTAQP